MKKILSKYELESLLKILRLWPKNQRDTLAPLIHSHQALQDKIATAERAERVSKQVVMHLSKDKEEQISHTQAALGAFLGAQVKKPDAQGWKVRVKDLIDSKLVGSEQWEAEMDHIRRWVKVPEEELQRFINDCNVR